MITNINKIFIVIILSFILYILFFQTKKETFINYKSCNNNNLDKALVNVLKQTNSEKVNKDWKLYLPCDNFNLEKELSKLSLNKNQYVFGISGSDYLASKNTLWEVLKNKYLDNVTEYVPKSYLPNDIELFKNDYKLGQLYILKKNLQQQKGINISKNFDFIVYSLQNKTINIVQELLNNPLLVDGRKINMRVYLLVICNDKHKNAYIHNNGFIYYTKQKYSKKKLDFDYHITTGYIDRSIYENNPLTHTDLYQHLDNIKEGNSKILQNNIVELMRNIFEPLKKYIGNNKKLQKGTSFQLFGCDVAPDKNLDCKLIEINKGPDLNFKDERDGEVKKDVLYSIFSLLKIDNNPNNYVNNFIKL